MFDEDKVQDTSADTTPTPETTSKTEKPVDWEASYNGMKGTAIKAQKQLEAKRVAFDALNEEKTALELERDRLKDEVEAARQEANQHKDAAAKLGRKFEITRIIQSQFPVLAGVYDDDDALGVLLNLNGDALTNHLTKMADRIGVTTETRKQDKAAGSTPPPPAAGADRQSAATTANEARSAITTAMTTYGFNSPQYQEAMTAYERVIRASQVK